MSQYVPYIPEVLPESPLFTPDLNFFDQMMQRKQSMFEQGLSKARVAYSSVLNAPLANKNNIPLRDQYVKDATENLKSLASADLSLPQNVTAAENVFAPFWQDKFIMKDMELTKSYQNGFQTLDAWKNSLDPKVRENYSGITEKYLMNGFDKLQNATRSDESFSSIEKRKPVAFANIQSYLEDQAAKAPDKLQIVWDRLSPDGAYLINTTNGERVKQNFASWAQSQIGSNFYQQFNVIGITEKEEQIKMIKQQFPGMSDQEAVAQLADNVVKELAQGYDKRRSINSVEEVRINAILKAMPATLTSEQQKEVVLFQEQLADIRGRNAALDEEYKNFNQTKDVRRQSVLQNPDGYFATLAKQRVIDGWATGRASIQSNKITINEAWFKAAELRNKDREFQRDVANDAWDQQVDQWNMANGNKAGNSGRNGKTGAGNDNLDPTQNPNLSDGYDPLSKGIYVGLGDKDITKTGTAYDNYTQKMDQLFTDAHNKIFNPQGVMFTLKNLGLNDEQLVNVSSALRKEVTSLGNNTDYNFTKEEKEASNEAGKLLLQSAAVKAAGITKVTGPYSLRNAVMAYAGEFLKDRNKLYKDGTLAPSEEEQQAMVSYARAITELNLYSANEEKRKELIEKNILTDEKTYGKLVVEKNGKKDLITSNDLAVLLPKGVDWGIKIGGRTLTNNDIASLYLQGRLDVPRNDIGVYKSGQVNILIDGESYIQPTDIKKTGPFAALRSGYTVNLNETIHNVLEKRFGKPADLNKLYKGAMEKVVPDLLYYSSQTGKMGVEFSHSFDKKRPMAEDKNARIFNAALNTSNAEYYDDEEKELSAEDITKIQGLLMDETRMETYVGSYKYLSQGIKGRPTIRFSITDQPSESATNGVDLSKLKTQTINLSILPTATSPDLKDLPTNSGAYVHDKILRGQKYQIDSLISASGFDAVLQPMDNTNPDQVKSTLKYQVRVNKKNEKGQLISTMEDKEYSEMFNLKGTNAKNPDEMVEYVFGQYFRNLAENYRLHKQYMEAQKAAPAPQTISKEDFFRSLNIQLK